MAPGRNDACPCGSGEKFKRCCAVETSRSNRTRNMLLVALLVLLVTAAAATLYERARTYDPDAKERRWCPTHQTWHEVPDQ